MPRTRNRKSALMTDLPLDMSVVDSLKDLGGEDDPELFSELVDAFLTDAPARLDAIDRCIASGDVEGVARAAHPLKSSAANMGAVGLAEICRRLETDAMAGKDAGLLEYASLARTQYEAAARALIAAR